MNVDLAYPYIWGFMLYDFKSGLKAAELVHFINRAFDEDIFS